MTIEIPVYKKSGLVNISTRPDEEILVPRDGQMFWIIEEEQEKP